MSEAKMTCPRRGEDFMDSANSPFVSAGRDRDYWNPTDNTCTYCGSLNPDVFMARLEAQDAELVPSDKNYKAYIKNAGGESFKQTYRDDKEPFQGWDSPVHHWITRETNETKFYYDHLSEQQRRRFIDLLNEKKMKIAYPGHLYCVPFFCIRKDERAN